MIDPKCPECGALLKKKDIKNDKCWKCKAENIAEYYSLQENIKKAEEKETKVEISSKERKELEDMKIELERKRQKLEDIEIRKAKESSRPLSEKEKEKHYWSFLSRLNSWLTVEIVITLGLILILIFNIASMFDTLDQKLILAARKVGGVRRACGFAEFASKLL